MRVSDTELVVSAVFRLAKTDGKENISPGKVVSFLNEEIGVNIPLHQVTDVFRDLDIVTHKVGNVHFIVWDEGKMSKLKNTTNSLIKNITEGGL